MSLQVDFVGHSTLLIELDGVRLLTDPATRGRIGPLRRVVRVPDRHRLAGIDLALISHLHWDHLDVPSLQDLGRNVPVLVPRGAGRWLETAGFRHVTEIARSLTTTGLDRAPVGRNSDGRDGKRTGNTGHVRSLTVDNGHSKTDHDQERNALTRVGEVFEVGVRFPPAPLGPNAI